MKWAYLILTEDYDLYGTNDRELAKKQTEWAQVYDVGAGKWLADNGFDREVKEYKEYKEAE